MWSQLKNILEHFFAKGMDREIRRFALSGSIGNGAIQLFSIALVFITQIVISRLGGDEAYGTYSQVFNWITVLFVIATFGADTLLVKQIPIYESQGDKRMVKSVYVWSNVMMLFVALFVILLFALLVNYGNVPGLSNNAYYFNISLPGIVFGACMASQQAYLRGIKKVVLGQTAEKLAKPIALILAIMFFGAIAKATAVTSYVWANVFAFATACFYALYLVYKNRHNMKTTRSMHFEWSDWTKRSLHFTLGALLFMLSIRLDVLMIGSLMTNVETGYYNIALKFADIAIFPYIIVSHTVAPLYSKFKQEGRKEDLQSLFRNMTRVIFLLTLLIFIAFIIGGKFVLSLFGDNFVIGYLPLVILAFGKLVAAFIGPIGLMMVMLGLEKYNNLGLMLQILTLSISLYILIPLFGLLGAAISTCLGLIVFQTTLAIIIKRKMDINPTIFG